MDAFWYCCFSGSVEKLTIFNTGLYEIIPGFIFSLIVAIVVSLADKEPSKEIEDLFDEVANMKE